MTHPLVINDIPVTSSYTVYDRDTGHHVFTWFDTEKYGDIPPDIAFLPVDGIRTEGGILCIDTHTGNTAP